LNAILAAIAPVKNPTPAKPATKLHQKDYPLPTNSLCDDYHTQKINTMLKSGKSIKNQQ
jgi:hypothetical protein